LVTVAPPAAVVVEVSVVTPVVAALVVLAGAIVESVGAPVVAPPIAPVEPAFMSVVEPVASPRVVSVVEPLVAGSGAWVEVSVPAEVAGWAAESSRVVSGMLVDFDAAPDVIVEPAAVEDVLGVVAVVGFTAPAAPGVAVAGVEVAAGAAAV
jgi:hypothetical protein